jgi:hypothetical protein
MICCVNFVLFNPRIKERKRIITHYQKNGITTLKKHLDANHAMLAKTFEEEINSPLKYVLEKQPAKKGPMHLALKHQSSLVQKIILRQIL